MDALDVGAGVAQSLLARLHRRGGVAPPEQGAFAHRERLVETVVVGRGAEELFGRGDACERAAVVGLATRQLSLHEERPRLAGAQVRRQPVEP